MTIKEEFASIPDFFFDANSFAEEVLYAGQDDVPRMILVIFRSPQDVNALQEVVSPSEVMQVMIKAADVAAPDFKDTITTNPGTVSEQTWYIRNNLGKSTLGDTWTLEISKSERRRI